MKHLFFLLCTLLFIHTNLSALDDVDLEFEVGMTDASFGGDIANTSTTTDFDTDLGFDDTKSSYFSLKAKFKPKWMPTVRVNFLNFSESSLASVVGQKIGDTTYTEDLQSDIEYRVINTLLYYEFKSRGKKKRMFGKQRYTGDMEVDIGINLKNVDFSFNTIGLTTGDTEYINVQSSILLPYVGMRYYLYYLSVYADISTLSFSDTKATSYSFGVDYQMIRDFYIALSYFYEDFEKDIVNDTVTFETSGLIFSIKYNF